MASGHTNLLQGTLDLLILKALALGELHGLGVSRRVEQITRVGSPEPSAIMRRRQRTGTGGVGNR